MPSLTTEDPSHLESDQSKQVMPAIPAPTPAAITQDLLDWHENRQRPAAHLRRIDFTLITLYALLTAALIVLVVWWWR